MKKSQDDSKLSKSGKNLNSDIEYETGAHQISSVKHIEHN